MWTVVAPIFAIYIVIGIKIKKAGILIKPKLSGKVFSINRVWDKLIASNELYAIESNIDFLHVSTLDVYKSLIKKKLNVE